MALTRSRHDRFPVLVLDGRGVGGSNAIVAALEERFPDPPLYPADPQERARALELEAVFDDELAPAVRRFAFHHTFNQKGGIAAAVVPHRPVLRKAFEVGEPLARAIIRSDYGATPQNLEAARATILAVADRVEAELGDGDYLVGGQLSVADVAGAALFTPLLMPPGREYPPEVLPDEVLALREALTARRAGQWVEEMYVRHRTQDRDTI